MQASTPSEHELIARLDRQRGQLLEAADGLREPAHRVSQAEHLIRNGLPLLPYAVAAIAVIGIASALLRGRRVQPVVAIATGLDLWRLWKSYQQSSARSKARAQRAVSYRPHGE